MFLTHGTEKSYKYKTASLKISIGDVFDHDAFLPQYVKVYKVELYSNNLYVAAYVDFNRQDLIQPVINKMKDSIKAKIRGDPW